jgi:RHH-type transcriptional regulator, rel operon repressor / antitoxin RelB
MNATALARPANVATEALATYLETQAWQVNEVETAIDQANNGQFATQTQVNGVFAKFGA